MQLQITHLDAVQGSVEELKGDVQIVHRVSTGNTDTVMRQKLRQGFWLCQKAGLSGE